MNVISKLALATVVTLPLFACGGAADTDPSAAPVLDSSHVQPSNCGIFCIPLVTDKIAYSEWYAWQIHVLDTYYKTDTLLPVAGRHPILSPDQTKIAFVQSDGNIYVASATDGSGKVALTSGGGFDTPSWSPDGSTVVFASAGTAGYGANIYRAPATGGQGLWQITANPGTWYFEPRFLNANTIVFQVGLTGQAAFGLVASTAAYESSISYLGGLSGQLGDISVSPDGTKVAFTKVNGSCGHQALAIGSLSGTTVSSLHELFCSSMGDSTKPSIGGGNSVAFVWSQPSGGYFVDTVNSAGSGFTTQNISTTEVPPDMSMQ